MKRTEALQPGAVRVMSTKRSLVLTVGVYALKRGGQIHIDITGSDRMHTSVTNATSSTRYHRTLFRDLRRVLVAEGAWPFGEEGSETEERGT